MKAPLPAALQPTAADRARDSALAAEAKAILKEVEDAGGGRVKINTETYNSVTFGPDRSCSRSSPSAPQRATR